MKNKWEEKENTSQKKIENKQIEKNPEDSMKEIRIELMELLKKDIEEINWGKHNKKHGIYLIHNVVNNKIYVGSASDLYKRINYHVTFLNKQKHHSRHLQSAWNKYGKNNFKFYVLEIFNDKNMLIDREQYYLNTLLFASENDDRFDKFGYNKLRFAFSAIGYVFTDEQRRKISEGTRGERNGMYGKKLSLESRKKVSEHHADMRGSKSGTAKLTENQVIEIRYKRDKFKLTLRELSNEFGVTIANVSDIIKRKTWTHI